MKKKIYLRILILTLLFWIICGFCKSNNVFAATLEELTKMDYDTAIQYNIGEHFDPKNGLSVNGDGSNDGPANMACFHNSSLDTGDGTLEIRAKILIDPDGTMNGNGNYKATGRKMAKFGALTSCGIRTSGGSYYTETAALIKIYNEGINNIAGISTSGSHEYSSDNYNAATAYAESGEETYQAVVFILAGNGGIQDRIVVIAKEGNTPKAEITKYIKSVSGNYDGIIGSERASHKDDDSWKRANKPKVEKGATVTYQITIKNAGNCKLEGTFKDTFDSELEFISATANGSNINRTGENIVLENRDDKITITVKLKAKNISGSTTYKNTAQFTYKETGETIKSSDYFTPLVEKIEINKYITSADGSSYSRASMSESSKSGSPVDLGENSTSHTVNYNIVIKNEGSESITGTFTDTYDSEFSYISSNKSSGSTITIAPKSSVTITYTLRLAKDTSGGIYENRASFSWNSKWYGSYSKESSDWVSIDEPPIDPPSSTDVKKYIVSVNGTPVSGRSGLGITTKDGRPVEVEKGDTVKYRIDIKNNIWYQNKSGKNWCNGGGAYCDHYDDHQLDWLICRDTFASGLEYKSYSGSNVKIVDKNGKAISRPSGNELYFKWSNVDYDETVTVYLELTVTSSNMKKMNLENKVDDVRYQFTGYNCYMSHVYDCHCHNILCDGDCHHHRDDCDFSCSGTVRNDKRPGYFNRTYYSGRIGGEDYDYVRLLDPVVSGTVWLENTKDGYMRNGESIKNMSREEHKKVYVQLYRSDGTLIAGQTVNGNGQFNFGRVKKGPGNTGSVPDYNIPEGLNFKYTNDNLYNYYIVYNYDGERYEATVNLGTSNLNTGSDYSMKTSDYRLDSNGEEQDRAAFNNSLETIANDKAYAGTTSSSAKKDLAYYKEGNSLQSSILAWDGNINSSTTASVTMKAKSFTFYVHGGVDGDDTEYLKYINLGLVERESPDLSIKKDVVKAEVTINSHKTIYDYEKLGKSPYTINSSNVLSTPYTLSIYREDYEYRTSKYDETIQAILNENNPYKDFGRDNDLQVILTYKITVTNNSPSSSAIIREIVDYSSADLTLLTETVKIGDTTLNVSEGSSFENPGYSGNVYKQHFITGSGLTGKTLNKGESLDIYANYRVNKDANGYIILDKPNDGTEDCKMNIAEIAAYSFYKGNTPSGLVDKNSNPANIEFDGSGKAESNKFEDDTFETGVKVVLKDDPDNPDDPGPGKGKYYYRNISGVVFEEKDKTTNVDGQLVGNGIKDGNDIFAKNVLVKLYEVVQKKDGNGNAIEEYYVDTGAWYRTGSDGRYYFGDKTEKFENYKPSNSTNNTESTDDSYKLHPGLYTVRFIYGDEADYLVTSDGNTIRYSGQDYQSVKYQDVGDINNEAAAVLPKAFTILSGGGNSMFDNNGQPKLGSKIYSVAKDNEIRRLEVNEYSTTTTYPMDTVLKAGQKSEEAKLLAAHTSMFADTRAIDFDIEHCTNYSNYETKNIDGSKTKIENFYYSVRDVNFGITERPKTKLQLINDITEVRAITSDGNTLLDVLFDVIYTRQADGSIKHETKLRPDSIGISNVQVLDRNGNNQGFRYANIDTDLLQGMTITIKFKIAVANISEVDHLTNWLEEKIENESSIDLDVEYTGSGTAVSYNSDNSIVTDTIGGQQRKYDYNESYLYKLLYKGDSSKNINSGLRTSDTGVHTYATTLNSNSGLNVGSDNVKKVYTYTNVKNKIHNDYSTGYYLGNIYYNNVSSGNEAQVKTRVDQYIDYVDNDLIFKPEENVNSNNQITYLTYTTDEIAAKGLLKDIDPTVTSISDGQKDYYNKEVPNTNNNLAFNVEDGTINSDFYKFLKPIDSSFNSSNATSYLYNIDLQASRTLTSEVDLNGVEIDNIAEIVKATNTAGRKIYVKASEGNTGYIGNTTKDPIESINKPGSITTIVDVAKLELDTDFTEYVTFSPPTGLTGQDAIIKNIVDKTGNALLIIVPVIIIIVGMGYVIVQFAKRKKFYK